MNQLRQFGHFLPFPQQGTTCQGPDIRGLTSAATGLFRRHKIGAVLVEPVQARGGINVPPPWFLPRLRQLCDQHGALLIVDEIYTGFGRTGKWFACEHTRTTPDLICLGKALAGGFPISACVGRAAVMDAAWPVSTGEAIHTSTFLGHPVGCAMALAQIAEIRRLDLVRRSATLGKRLIHALETVAADVSRRNFIPLRMARTHVRGYAMAARGLGLMAGLELSHRDGSPATETTLAVIKRLLRRGFILLPEGEHGNVISFTPPLTITAAQLAQTVRALDIELTSVFCK